MSTGLIVHRLPGKTIPAAYRETVLKEFDQGLTVAKVEDGKVVMERLGPDANLAGAWEAFLTAEGDKDKHLLFFLDRESRLENEEQPMVMLTGKDGAPLMIGACEGDCEKYVTDTAAACSEVEMMQNWFIDKVSALYTNSGKDMTKTLALMDVASFSKEAEEHLAPRASVVVFTNTDAIRFINCNNAAYGKFDWGHVSNTMGHTDKPADPSPPPNGGGTPQITYEQLEAMPYNPRKAKLKELGFKNLEEAAAALKGQAAAAQRADEAVVDAAIKAKTAAPPTGGLEKPDLETEKGTISFPVGGEPIIYPPKNAKGHSLLKFYEKHLECHLGKGEKFHQKLVVKILGVAYDQRPAIPLSKLAGASHFIRIVNGTDKPDAAQGTRKDTTNHHIGSPGLVEGAFAMSPDAVAAAVATKTKQREIGPITEAQLAAPSKVASFVERLSTTDDPLSIEEVLAWTDYVAVAGDKASALGLLEDLRRYILRKNPQILKDLAAAASKAAAGTEIDPNTLPYRERVALGLVSRKTG